MERVGVVIPARNEEPFLGQTLDALVKQTLPPEKIVVVDDGSTDSTAEIARSYGAEVISLPAHRYSATGTPHMAKVVNQGLKRLRDLPLDYVMILSADQVLPQRYIEELVDRMEADERLVIASGRLPNTPQAYDSPMGGGRVIKTRFWKDVGYLYPVNYGWESYWIVRAEQMGYRVRCFPDLLTYGRRTSSQMGRYGYVGWGKAMRALGYHWVYALGRSVRFFISSPKRGVWVLAGYFSSVRRYSDIAQFNFSRQAYSMAGMVASPRMLLKRLRGT